MTPAEFTARYGPPVITRHRWNAAGGVVISPDPHRACITFLPDGAGWMAYPTTTGNVELDGIGLVATGQPVTFSITVHGTLPTIGWILVPPGLPANITVIQSRMTDQPPQRKGRKRE